MRTFLLVISITSILSAEVLKISFSRSKEEPYVFIDKRELTGDVLIVRKSDAQSLQNIDSLLGRKIGTLQGHSYPGLNPYFENKSIEGVENKKLINNMNQLRFGVIDKIIRKYRASL